MTTPARSFQLSKKKAAARRAENEKTFEPITYRINDEDTGEHRDIVAHFPGEGVFTVLVAQAGMADKDGVALAGSLFTALSKAFTENGDYDFLRSKVEADELDPLDLMDLVENMVEVWSAFPTQPQSGSTPSQPRTGGRSTGRVPARARTQESSPSGSPTDSAA
jgi:hypothetical protein